VLGPLLLGGCALYPNLAPGTVKPITGQANLTPLQRARALREQKTQSPILQQENVIVPPLDEPPPSADYVVGPYDSIMFTVSGHPEYSGGGASGMAASRGSRVDGSGNVQLPYLGIVPVAGLTLPQIRARLQEKLKAYLQDPSVVVEMTDYKSQPLYLLGQLRMNGTQYMDRPLKVLQGMAMAGGYDPSANLRAARIIRNNKIIPVDLYELLTRADQTQNVWLKPGDAIFIPDNRDQVVFVFGAVRNSSPIPIPPKGLTLLQAISLAGLQTVGYNPKRAYIIRSHSATRGELLVVDVDRIMNGDAMPMMMAEGDIVYIPKTALTTWNEAIGEMLPTLSAFGAIMQPFVQLRYLSQ